MNVAELVGNEGPCLPITLWTLRTPTRPREYCSNPPVGSGEEKENWMIPRFVFIRTSIFDTYTRFSFRQLAIAHKVLRITVQYIKLVQQTLYTGGAAPGPGGQEVITGMCKCNETNRTAGVN